MGSQDESWVDGPLGALAADDARGVVPQRVEAAVMRAWDERHAAQPAAPAPPPQPTRVWLLVSGIAAAVLMAVWLQRPAQPPAGSSADAETGYVLVPDPLADPQSLQVMRVRMPRAGLASLGWPMTRVAAGELVEVELVVGEDGIARSIRRATVVAAPITSEGQR